MAKNQAAAFTARLREVVERAGGAPVVAKACRDCSACRYCSGPGNSATCSVCVDKKRAKPAAKRRKKV